MEQIKDLMKNIVSCVSAQATHLDQADVKEMSEAMDMIKDLAMAEYYCQITKAMEDPENQYGEDYDENGPIRRGYSVSYPRRNMYRGYDPNWDMMPMRGYSDNNMSSRIYPDNMQMGYYEGNGHYRNGETGRYESARRGYEETKDINSLNKIFDVIEADMKELKGKMTGSDIATSKQRLMALANML